MDKQKTTVDQHFLNMSKTVLPMLIFGLVMFFVGMTSGYFLYVNHSTVALKKPENTNEYTTITITPPITIRQSNIAYLGVGETSITSPDGNEVATFKNITPTIEQDHHFFQILSC